MLFYFERNAEKISEASSASELTKTTSQLMRVLVQMKEYLNTLPNGVFLTMKLYYYADGNVYILIWESLC